MNIINKKVWAIIPARGGSKSIPLKNMVNLCGRPLMSYVIRAAKASKNLSRIICSTDDKRISGYCEEQGVEVHQRPENLSMDETPVLDVLRHLLKDVDNKEGEVAEIIVLLQPTSPFVLPDHIDECVNIILKNQDAQSSQTISNIPHNFHAYNQRFIGNGWLRFSFPNERKVCYNKQKKPTFYVFGNLIVTRSKTLIDDRDIFGTKSIPVYISSPYALDVDGPEDIEVAEWYLVNEKVNLKY